jgi:hypothetical protein
MTTDAQPLRASADLSADEQNAALSRYYAGVKIKDIMEEFGIAGTVGAFLGRFPPQPDPQRLCPHCRVPLWARPPTRTSDGSRKPKAARCADCGHTDAGKCRCDACRAAGRKRAAVPGSVSPAIVAREQSLRSAWEDSLCRCPQPSELNVRQALFLLASTAAGLDDTGTRIQALVNIATTLAPTTRYAEEMLLALYRSDLVAPDPDQQLAVSETDVLSYIEHHPAHIVWRLALGRTAEDNRRYLKRLSDLLGRHDAYAKDEIVAVWREVALAEAVAVLTWCQRRFALKTEPHPRLVSALDTLLEHLSLGVIAAQTYYSARALAGEIHGRSGGLAPEHARLRKKLLSKLESIRNGEFGDPSAFERLRELPPSPIAELLCLPQLGIGAEAYWYQAPTLDAPG